ncbi:MAG: YfiR family protein [Pseudomonadota bacterium]
MHSERRPLAWLLALACAASCHAEPVPEADMKAAFVFNFAVFTEWPQEVLPAGAAIQVCASSSNPLFPALSQLNDKVVNGHHLAVRTATAPLRSCHVLVLGSHDRERWSQLKHDLAGANVLTVSDDRGISADGAIIGMSMENLHVGFGVDMAAAKAARLTLSSKLLRLARSVN